MKASFLDCLKAGNILVSDGATGTNLLARGLPRGVLAEDWVLNQPQKVLRLMKDFIMAGADIVLTCTFGASPLRLDGSELSGYATEINQRAIEIGREAILDRPVYLGASIGPTGQLMKPFGPLDEDAAINSYTEQISALAHGGVDLLVIETQFSLDEARAVIWAIHSVCDLPIVCSFSFDRGTRTMMGVKPAQVAAELESLSVDLLGINCGRSLEDNFKALKELRQATDLPIWFKPNAGLPEVDEEGKTTYSVTPAQMGEQVGAWLEAGAQIVGGCCGTTPEHLSEIARQVKIQRKDA
jgi:5-methyltetrahydrofolate--homocysteine methyltransferase